MRSVFFSCVGFFALVHIVDIIGTIAYLTGLGTYAGKGFCCRSAVLGEGHFTAGINTGAAELTITAHRLPGSVNAGVCIFHEPGVNLGSHFFNKLLVFITGYQVNVLPRIIYKVIKLMRPSRVSVDIFMRHTSYHAAGAVLVINHHAALFVDVLTPQQR